MTYNDYASDFDSLLALDRSVSIHKKNLQVLATLLYKIKDHLSPEILNEIFPFNNQPYYLRTKRDFQRENVSTVRYGTESLSFIAPKIWSPIPEDIKKSPTLEIFKQNIKNWKTNECQCRLCKTYIAQAGFIQVSDILRKYYTYILVKKNYFIYLFIHLIIYIFYLLTFISIIFFLIAITKCKKFQCCQR